MSTTASHRVLAAVCVAAAVVAVVYFASTRPSVDGGRGSRPTTRPNGKFTLLGVSHPHGGAASERKKRTGVRKCITPAPGPIPECRAADPGVSWWSLCDVSGNGDCFLHAVEGALRDAVRSSSVRSGVGSVIPAVASMLDDADATADASADASAESGAGGRVAALRSKFVAYLRSSERERALYAQAFRHVSSVAESSPQDRDAIVAELPQWTASAIAASATGAEFVEACLERLERKGTWFGELEVRAFARMAWTAYGVCIVVRASDSMLPKPEDLFTVDDDAHTDPASTIFLVNTGGVHFVYACRPHM